MDFFESEVSFFYIFFANLQINIYKFTLFSFFYTFFRFFFHFFKAKRQ